MAKVKLTKGELKRQRDCLKQYLRYLPTLQLKKQQLQIEILHQLSIVEDRRQQEGKKVVAADTWLGLLSEPQVNLKPLLKPLKIITDAKNIAGVDIPVFVNVEFPPAEYDLFTTPLWVDAALEALKILKALRQEILVLQKGIEILRRELRITTQRVNLFEKVKIPESEEAIRLIRIYLGDQMANAVGRSKIAKAKIERMELVAV